MYIGAVEVDDNVVGRSSPYVICSSRFYNEQHVCHVVNYENRGSCRNGKMLDYRDAALFSTHGLSLWFLKYPLVIYSYS